VHQSSIKFEFEKHQIQSNSFGKYLWKKGEKDALFRSENSPASPKHLAVAQLQLGPHARSPRALLCWTAAR
jgi:hypothetical protein